MDIGTSVMALYMSLQNISHSRNSDASVMTGSFKRRVVLIQIGWLR